MELVRDTDVLGAETNKLHLRPMLKGPLNPVRIFNLAAIARASCHIIRAFPYLIAPIDG